MVTSFRDPAGQLVDFEGRVLRLINQSGELDLRAFLATTIAQELTDAGRLVRTRIISRAEVDDIPPSSRLVEQFARKDIALVVEHDRVPFQSYPYEWPPEMIHAAAQLTLDLADSLLDCDFGLKDATPYNVLYHGPNPVFVDWLSFERRDPCDPTWLPYAQFVRTFLLPLLVNKHFNLRLDQLLLANRDGLEPEAVYRLCSSGRRLLPPFLTLVTLPTWLAGKGERDGDNTYRKRLVESREKARYILSHVFKGLRRKLKNVAPEEAKTSNWSDYMSKNRYAEDYFPTKQRFVEASLDDPFVSRVLDVGCNTGFFSLIAARQGAKVVSIDYDPVVIGEVWRRAKSESLDILPLVINLAQPTPSTGWLNSECPSFLERARGSFDAVLMLAVIHHMLVCERIPLTQILQMAASLTTRLLILEYVPPDDPMFRRLTRGRDHLHQDLTRESFEDAAKALFDIVRSERLGDTARWLYVLRKRGALVS